MADGTTSPRLVTYDAGIDYADGSEKALFDIVASEAFDESVTWRGAKGWAQYYHLSPLRRNLLSWMRFQEERPLRILELGAGCGAITSWLVTVPSARVVAVEGTLDRAKVIAERCKHAGNLEIHACPIDRFVPDAPFDVITLIGVLEYAGKYEQGEDPFAAVLARAGGWLKDDGLLMVAIENQLGVKYLSGTPEDHYGVAYEGVNGYPHYNGVRTFTTASLSGLLTKTGYPVQSWYYPYPDYKLPSVVFSRAAFGIPEFDWSGLVDVPFEPNENQKPSFSDRTFLRLAHENGTLSHFMNSFLVVAAKQPENIFAGSRNADVLAVKSNVKFRGRPFQTQTAFRAVGSGIQVTKSLPEGVAGSVAEGILHVITAEPEPYFPKTVNLLDAIIEATLDNDAARVAGCFRLWDELLTGNMVSSDKGCAEAFGDFCRQRFDRVLYEGRHDGKWISGRFLDLMPLNILIAKQGPVAASDARIIDLEWQCSVDVPLQLVFDRGLELVVVKVQRYFQPHRSKLHPDSGLPVMVHDALHAMSFSAESVLLHSRIFETWFQSGVANGSFAVRLNWASIIPQLEAQLARKPVSMSMEQFVEAVVQMVEKGRNTDAIAFYDKYRQQYVGHPQFKEFERVIEGLRQKLQ